MPDQAAASDKITIEPPDPARLAQQISAILSADVPDQQKVERLLQTAVGLVNAAGAIFFRQDGDALEAAAHLVSKQAAAWSDDVIGECSSHARQVLLSGSAGVAALRDNRAVSIISCPLTDSDGGGCCLCTIAVLGDHQTEPFMIVLQMITALTATVIGLTGSREAGTLLHHLCALDSADGKIELGAALQQWAGCDTVAIGSARGRSASRIEFISNVTAPDKKTHLSRLYVKVFDESRSLDATASWPPDSDDGEPAERSLVLGELVRETGMQRGVVRSLKDGDNPVTLVFLWQKQGSSAAVIDGLERSGALPGLILQRILNDSPQAAGPQSAGVPAAVKIGAAGIVLALLGCFVLLPVPFNLHPQCRVEPQQIRAVTAKFDALIDAVTVEQGDQVAADDLLVQLDGREIELELSSIEADSSKSLKMRDNHHVRGDVAAAQLAQLEYQRLQERAKLLLIRQSQLAVQSPIDGIVLRGELKQRKGAPVEKGQILFEVAPLETLRVEMGIGDEDIGHVTAGQEVSVRFDAYPNRSWSGRLKTVSPQSTMVNSENVFIAAFELANDDGLLQPGMHGIASIQCGTRSPAWIYFHKPWYATRRLLRSIF